MTSVDTGVPSSRGSVDGMTAPEALDRGLQLEFDHRHFASGVDQGRFAHADRCDHQSKGRLREDHHQH